LFVVIDNLRYDQWKTKCSNSYYKLEKKYPYYSIYLRLHNMLEMPFLWLLPTEMEKVSRILENDPEEVKYMKPSFFRHN
jgi:hypothetical protein